MKQNDIFDVNKRYIKKERKRRINPNHGSPVRVTKAFAFAPSRLLTPSSHKSQFTNHKSQITNKIIYCTIYKIFFFF